MNSPNDTQSFALIIHDPDGRNWVHWAVFNIPPNYNEIIENASGNNMPIGSIELNNQFRTPGYGGPEPPRGSWRHEYKMTLYALNTALINDLGSFRSYAEIISVLEGKIIAKAEITGTYSRD
ncbi:MAG: YbhB/YbcL family Raf kinase inhibitor-like protein [Treponema sp.]|nr:YbhB/YbcL family Raf kinase inhibitor-like protein [Treponema sp.]